MSDLTEALQEALLELDQMSSAVHRARTSASEARVGLSSAARRLETRASRLPARVRTTLDRLELDASKVETASQQFSAQLDSATAWVGHRQQQLDYERAKVGQELFELREQLQRARVQLDQQRQTAVDAMERASQTTFQALATLAAEMETLANWVTSELIPSLRQQKGEVDTHADSLRVQILDQTVPAITSQYLLMQGHLRQLAVDLTAPLEGNAIESRALARYALEQLAGALNALCACCAEETRAVVKIIEGEERHLAARSQDLFKHAKIYAELGTPGGLQVRSMVDAISNLEDLLIKAKVLPPRPGESGGML